MGRSLPPASLSGAVLAYPALLVVLERLQSKSDPTRLARAFKAVSTVHSLLCAALAVQDVLNDKWKERNLIFHRDEHSNSIVALELGYLLQDTVALLVAKSRYGFRVDRRVWLHHAVYISLLTAFFEYASRGAEYGVFFVEAFLIMNASTPLLNVKWLLRRSSSTSSNRVAIDRVLDVLLLGVYATSRLGLLLYMLSIYGKRKGLSIIEAYKSIPLQCRIGTLSIGFVNAFWFSQLALSVVYNKHAHLQ